MSYARPTVSAVTGCQSNLAANHAAGCARQGGTIITVSGGSLFFTFLSNCSVSVCSGANFGSGGATVLIGALPCPLSERERPFFVVAGFQLPSSIAASATHLDSQLSCRLPAGTLASRPVLVLSRNGDISLLTGFVTYTPCDPGFLEAGNSTHPECQPCAKGGLRLVCAVK